MLLKISTLEEIEKESQLIDDFLNVTYSDDINELSERLIDLGVYLARTSKLLADSKVHQDKAVISSTLKNIDIDISPSNLKKLIESTCYRENYLVNWLDRLNRTTVHQIDSVRTLISRVKEELKYEYFNNQNI